MTPITKQHVLARLGDGATDAQATALLELLAMVDVRTTESLAAMHPHEWKVFVRNAATLAEEPDDPPCFKPPFTARLVLQKHTGTDYYITMIAAEGCMSIAYVYHPTRDSMSDGPLLLKMGRLFAAAPELLAALEQLVALQCKFATLAPSDWQIARAAIAKAKGE